MTCASATTCSSYSPSRSPNSDGIHCIIEVALLTEWNREFMSRGETYGHRARIGYTCPPLSAEVFPYEFYQLVPDGVTLVITTLTVIERSKSEVDQAYEMSMRAARELAAAGVDLVFLGGVQVKLSRGNQEAKDMLRTLASELGVKVSSSVAAQAK